MTLASANIFPKVTFVEGSAPSSPSANDFHLYFDSSDHLLKWKNSAGTVTTIATGAAGSVATDAIWDAAGDLAVGSGADTAAKLSLGAAGGAVSRVNGAVAWNSGTSMPTAATGDRYWRTDLGMEAYYDGTRWLTTQLLTVPFPPKTVLDGTSTSAINAGRMAIPFGGVYALWIVSWDWLVVTGGSPYTSSVYWTAKLNWADTGDTDTQLGSTLDSKTATSANSNYNFRQDIGAALSTSARELKLRLDPVSSPTAISYTGGFVTYRMILT
jgi:hypothetical protein